MLKRIPQWLVAGAIAFVIVWIVSHGRSTYYNNYVLLARAFLDGRTWIDWPGPYIDALAYHGHYYIIEAPLPALLLVPLVAIFHDANQTLLCAVLAGIGVGAAWELGRRLGVKPTANVWICAFLLGGTDLLWCAMLGDVWFAAHVSAACFTLLALVELAGKRRGWLVALWGACAFESRFSLVLVLPVYLYLLVTDADRPFAFSSRRRGALFSFIGVLVPVAALWVLYNQARWGTWSDIGYTTWYHQDQAGMPLGSPFKLTYLPYQLWSFFVQAPAFTGTFPWIAPSISGVALTWTSPALILSFFARQPVRFVLALWTAALLSALPNVLYYVNGFAQFGMRHALDFEPFLLALMMLAARGRERLPWWNTALIAYSIIVGLWGCWYWNVFVRAGS